MNGLLDALDTFCETLARNGGDAAIMELAWKRVLRVPPDMPISDSEHPFQKYGAATLTYKESSDRIYTALCELVGETEPLLQTIFRCESHILYEKMKCLIEEYRAFVAEFTKMANAIPSQHISHTFSS